MRVKRDELSGELWRLFTLEEERSTERDVHGRVLAKSLSGDPTVPVISEFLYERGFRAKWPRGKRFAACLTHDVDWAYPPPKHTEKVLRGGIGRVPLRAKVLWRLGSNSGWRLYNPYSLDRIIEVEREFSAVSSFMVKATPKEWLDEKHEDLYNLNYLASRLERLIDNGWEVGLHAGYASHDNSERLAREKALLESTLNGYRVAGVRMHYLRFSYPDTWLAVEAAGFKYDTTLAFPDRPGFRNGMCYPFHPVVNDRMLNILEIPLAVMDTTFWGYMRVQPSEALEMIRELACRVERVGGVLTVLWHNNTFCELLYGEWGRMYRSLLSFLRDRGAWLTNCLNLWEYWVDNYG
ncbi:MAG: polysaccharide deacetylase family protein [Thermofilum sp.]